MNTDETEPNSPIEAPTLVDVARQAGVNKVTASIVLSGGQGNTRVSAVTRDRILQAAAQLRYQPNALARSLRSRRTHTIGFYVSGFADTRDLFTAAIISGLQKGCEENQNDFLMHGTFSCRSTDEVYAHLLNGKVDGLVIHVLKDDPLMPRLADSHLRVVAIADPVAFLPSVAVDDALGSRLLVEHLAQKGHRHVLYASAHIPLTSAIRREQAFLEAARQQEMEVTIQVVDPNKPIETEILALSSRRRPTAVVCWNDHTAYRVTAHIHALGLRVPEDFAVAGFDGISTLIPPLFQLTTIRAPWHEVARTAISILCSHPGKPLPDETVLPVELVSGETT